jgi:hypothetical protein
MMAGTSSTRGTSQDEFEPGRVAVPETGATMPLMPDMPTVNPPAVESKTSELPQVGTADRGDGAGGGAGGTADGGDGAGGDRAGGGAGGDGGAATGLAPASGADRGPRVLRGLFWLLASVAVVVALVLGLQAVGLLPKLTNPFASKQADRSQPVLLKSIQDLSRFVAAEGNFEVIIDLQENRKNVPDFLLSERTLFVAAGSVEAYVDFSSIGQGAITDSADHKSVEIKLPAPALGKPNIDNKRSYVFAEQRGLANRVGDLFGGGNLNRYQQLLVLAEQKIADSARESELAVRARDNTQKMLDAMLRSLGYTSITITFAAP